jgi:hypothetical protein
VMPLENSKDLVLSALSAHAGKMSVAEIEEASGLAAEVVEASLQALLLRREVVCGSYQQPGQGGQGARFTGEIREPVWSLIDEEYPRSGGSCFVDSPSSRRGGVKRAVACISFTSPPRGEAPDDIRRAWVGLSVPVTARESQLLKKVAVSGIVSGHAEHWDGYSIESRKCIEHLRAHNPKAAAWWRDNFPHFLKRGRSFIWSAESCELSPLGRPSNTHKAPGCQER